MSHVEAFTTVPTERMVPKANPGLSQAPKVQPPPGLVLSKSLPATLRHRPVSRRLPPEETKHEHQASPTRAERGEAQSQISPTQNSYIPTLHHLPRVPRPTVAVDEFIPLCQTTDGMMSQTDSILVALPRGCVSAYRPGVYTQLAAFGFVVSSRRRVQRG